MGGAGMSSDDHPEAHPDYVARSRQAAVDRRLREREELIALIREALNANGYVVDRGYVAMADIRDAADAVLAGGWRRVRFTVSTDIPRFHPDDFE
jgi:hypothetical protein